MKPAVAGDGPRPGPLGSASCLCACNARAARPGPDRVYADIAFGSGPAKLAVRTSFQSLRRMYTADNATRRNVSIRLLQSGDDQHDRRVGGSWPERGGGNETSPPQIPATSGIL